VEYWLDTLAEDSAHLLPLARAADELGFAGISVPDHSVMPDVIQSEYPGGKMPWAPDSTWPDVWVQIGAMAAVTKRLRFVTNVYVLPVRHPLVAARAIGTAAVLSDNRVVLGIGIGWMAEEFAAADQTFTNRGKRADEALEILQLAFADGLVEFKGTHYTIPRLRLNPAPTKPVPIWVGGDSPAALRRAARFGDGWIIGVPQIKAQGPALRRELEKAGRADAPFDLAVGSSPETPPSDSELSEWGTLGIGHLAVKPWRWWGDDAASLEGKLKALERFAANYLK
jgi:probable F420-dependent oxidoreductase